jgi:heptosyltransferase-1
MSFAASALHERIIFSASVECDAGVAALMRVLIIKTSSMGDVIHTLPALTDAGNNIPGIQFDWVVEESFAEIPNWHPLVNKVIPVALRRWRKSIFSSQTRQEWRAFYQALRSTRYDLIIDAQGLLKSAALTWLAKGTRCGLNWDSAREPFASLFYQQKCNGGKIKGEHAVTRTRKLFSAALGYTGIEDVPDYGIDREKLTAQQGDSAPYMVFLHGTTWATKHWPEAYWQELAKLVNAKGFKVKLLWGSIKEKERAERIAANNNVDVLPRMKLAEIAGVLAGAKAIVAVDTGLAHLAAALDVPTVSLYGPTDPLLTGALGRSQIHLSAKFSCAPCFGVQCSYRENDAAKIAVEPPCFSTVLPVDVLRELNTLF